MTGPPTLIAEDLVHRFGRQAPVLRGVSLRIGTDEMLALTGPSGGGKTTLARCLAGLVAPESGSLRWNGETLAARRTPAQRRAIQYVWQSPIGALNPYRTALESATEPLEGFRLVPRRDIPRAAGEMLRRLGLPSDALGRRPHQLSGGQCQRVVLARALLADPQVLLLDEPFSALDPMTTRALLDDLRAALTGRRLGVLLITHDQRLARPADRRLVLDGGLLRDA